MKIDFKNFYNFLKEWILKSLIIAIFAGIVSAALYDYSNNIRQQFILLSSFKQELMLNLLLINSVEKNCKETECAPRFKNQFKTIIRDSFWMGFQSSQHKSYTKVYLFYDQIDQTRELLDDLLTETISHGNSDLSKYTWKSYLQNLEKIKQEGTAAIPLLGEEIGDLCYIKILKCLYKPKL